MAGFKKGTDGSLFNAYDTMNESFKLLEDAITGLGVNTEEKNFIKIGVNTDAQNWYLEDTKNYEWDGAKNQFTTD